MGLCLSRCGDAHQQAAVVGTTISHQKSFDNNTESLKNFLHLHANVDAKKSFSSPRTSLGESLVIPHSSELFSLPGSEPERSSFAISPSPGQTSRASVSSRITSSPKSRNSFSVWGGRFSIDKTSGCRKRIRPARSAGGLAGEQDLAAHQRLIEAIARLERLNDGKNLGLRGSSFCSSDLEPKSTTQTLPKSRSGELNRPGLTTSRSRHVRHYQLPLQLRKSTMCPKDNHDPAIAFSQPKTMGNLVALATPVIKQMPLEKSVTNFLREVESFVSLIEAPQLSLSSEAMQDTMISHQEPLIITTVPKSIPRLPSYRFDYTDSDEMFTFFEASSEDSEDFEVRKKQSPIATSLHRLVQSATQGCHRTEKSPVAEKAVVMPVAKSAKSTRECKSSPSKSNSVDQSADQSGTVTSAEAHIESADPGIVSMREEKVDAARPALIEADTNVEAMMKKSPSVKRSPSRMRALKGFRRRLSRSLDSRESAVIHVDFDPFRYGPTPIEASRLSNVSDNRTTTAQAISIDVKSTELGFLPVTSTSSCPDAKLEQAVRVHKDEESCTELLDTSTIEVATSEQPSPQVMLVADQIPTTSAESCLGEPESLDQNPSTAELDASELPSLHELLFEDQSPSTSAESSFRECDNLDNTLECPETTARCEESLSPESTECTELASPSLSNSCPTETRQADFHPIPGIHSEVGDSQRFLSKAFNSLLKLLLVTDTEQTGPECTAALDQDEKMGFLEKETPD